jgi:NAD(P)-dependent dehydrogenase (short-subunit alcohol dehydrogenase family)
VKASDLAGGVWFITGGSSGLGRALADEIVSRNGRVTVTSRGAKVEGELSHGGRLLTVRLDLTAPSSFEPALQRAELAFGSIDVLVNNAGYGLLGAIEETSESELRDQLEANFFGPAALTTRLIPGFRERGRGAVVNVSSVSGVTGAPGSAYYAASKHALEGWSDALRLELAPFGVRVMVVEPGSFRTDFFGRSRHHTRTRLGVYDAVEARRASVGESFGRQPGDPARGACAVLAALLADAAPERLVIGAAAVDLVAGTLSRRVAEVEAWRVVSSATDFPAIEEIA